MRSWRQLASQVPRSTGRASPAARTVLYGLRDLGPGRTQLKRPLNRLPNRLTTTAKGFARKGRVERFSRETLLTVLSGQPTILRNKMPLANHEILEALGDNA